MTRAIPRLELWDGLACNSGARLGTGGFVKNWITAETTNAEQGEESFPFMLPLTAEAAQVVKEMHVVRIWRSDTDWDEWIVRKVAKKRDLGGRVTVTCGPLSYLLAEHGFVAEWQVTDPAGDPLIEFQASGTPTDLLQTYLIDNPKVAARLPFLALGTIAPTAEVSVSIANDSARSFINKVIEQSQIVEGTPFLFQFPRNGSTSYDITVRAI